MIGGGIDKGLSYIDARQAQEERSKEEDALKETVADGIEEEFVEEDDEECAWAPNSPTGRSRLVRIRPNNGDAITRTLEPLSSYH